MSASWPVVYKTCKVKEVDGCWTPSVATTATVDTSPEVGDTRLAPHPVQSATPPAMPANSCSCAPRRFFRLKQQSPKARLGAGMLEFERRGSNAASFWAVTIKAVEAVVPAGTTVAGEKLHVVPAGKPEQLNETLPAKPLPGMIKTLVKLACPRLTVTELVESLTAKVGEGRLIV